MRGRFIAAILVAGFLERVPAQSVSGDYRPPTVGIMLSFEHKPSGYYLQRLQRDVEAIFEPSHLSLRWEVFSPNRRPGSYSRAIVVNVRGGCGSGRVYDAEPNREPHVVLGWTIVNDGEVIPHAAIDCDRIAAVVAAARTNLIDRHLLPGLYHRLTARVLAHELMHALLRSSDHNTSDCLKTPLRLADLLAPARLSSHNLQALREVGRPASRVLAQTP